MILAQVRSDIDYEKNALLIHVLEQKRSRKCPLSYCELRQKDRHYAIRTHDLSQALERLDLM
jgi:hypothetical protein